MRLARTLVLAVAFAAATPAVAMAQFTPIPNAAQTPPGGGGQPACAKDFLPIRENTEKAAAAIKVATEKKPPLAEVCKLFNAFMAAETKMLKFMETNNVWCGIPPQAIEQVKTNHAKVGQVRKKVCDAAKGGGTAGAPPPPSLSDALGTTRVPDATTTTTKSGGGTFDTLTGNPLAR
ncbi:MAG: hypothetical protein HY659_15600 [Rhizobiales bacterium]|nr:hypothetical protein [Hyphomicrobiales bacterium]